MRLAVDTGAYASAGGVLYDANHGVTETIARLAGALDACGGMSGADSGGREWAQTYDRVAGDLVRAGADLGGSLGSLADLIDTGLANHTDAEQSACLVPGAVGGVVPSSARVGERLTPAALPSAFGGVGGEPAAWTWLAAHLEGLLWPDADTGRMRTAGAVWSAAAAQLEGWASSATGAAYLLEGQRSPEIPVAKDAVRELGRHGADLAGVCRNVGEACTSYAEQVDEHHAELVGICHELMTWTVVDQTTGVVLSFFTGGGAEIAAQLIEGGVMARFAARVVAVLRRLVELARVAAELVSRGLETVTRVLVRLRAFLALRTVRALERFGVTIVGRRALSELPAELRVQVEDAIERSRIDKRRFPKHDGEEFGNWNPKYQLPPGEYTEWTAAASGSGRGAYRVLIRGDAERPDAIYIWDHVGPPVRIGP
ncbi:MAG: hypothetical protein QM747_10745 [Nocardioides sp.]